MRCFAVNSVSPFVPLLPNAQRRFFNVIQRGNDREVKSLFALLGFDKDSESHRVHRTRAELRQGFMREAMKLTDPQHNKEDASKAAKLKKAYELLSNDRFRAQYAAFHYASPDASLHLLVDGGQVAANFNPEHQSFRFVDHALSGAAVSSSQRSSLKEQRSFSDFTSQYRAVVGAVGTSADAKPYDAREARSPVSGASINFMLRISFDESVMGCTKTAVYEKDVTCQHCSGSGRLPVKHPRRCPQCRGRGSTHLPSATYHIERTCTYCGGEGKLPPPRCTFCRGAGVVAGQTVHVPVDVRPGTTSMTVYRLRGKGNDGTRGGAAGDLIVTVLVQEHRIFHRDGLDLHMVLPISISTALLGGVVPVPLPHAACSVRVPPCARNGQRIRLAGKGVGLDGSRPAVVGDDGGGTGNSPHGSTRSGCGDLYVHLLVVIPKGEDLTGRQRCVIEKFVECAESNESDTSDEATPASLKERFRHWFES